MRFKLGFVAVLLFCASSLFAQQPTPKMQLSVFLTPQAVMHSESTGTDFDGGAGASLSVFWSQRWSTEIALSAQQSYTAATTTIYRDGIPATTYYRVRAQTYPVDLITQYHFLNQSKWQPYAGAGIRYVHKPSNFTHGHVSDQTSAEINGGVIYQFTPSWGLKLDAQQLLRADTAFYDSSTKGSVGVVWRH